MRIVLDYSGIQDNGALALLARSVLEAVVEHNRYLLNLARKEGVGIPPLFESGVRFRNEPWAGVGLARAVGDARAPALEEFAHLGIVMGRGWGDCAQLCAWRVAECREGWPIGKPPSDASFRIYCRPFEENRSRLYHVQTRHAPRPRFENDPKAGTIEDTSRLLDY